MTADHHRRAKEIFLAACESEEKDRAAFVNEACGGDEELRREVEELLRFHSEEETGLAGVGGALPAVPERIGSYRILQKVGEGGMGEVYEAEQTEPVRRRVALKVIKWGMDTKEVVARFESERQALALMDHPNIARVFEAGSTEQGRPYFAMEYVKGVAITDYCDTHRLSTRERLELFTQVCLGVQHAHQKGVIHRDMKPSNVLVTVRDDRPVPKIIDFGVAKATSQRLTERTLFTELGQWIGTPEYMSPEQAEMTGLDIDTRTDVYSLGVILYELLVGAQPFDSTTLRGAGFDEMRRRIRQDEPPRPSTRASSLGDDSTVAAQRRRTDLSTLVRELKGDLDWIVMKALEKDRTRRYGSPSELAADIDRHRRNEPVTASPPSAVYRVGKFIRRHRVALAAAVVVTMALVVGLVGTAVGLMRARQEAESASQVAGFLERMFVEFDPESSPVAVSSPETMLDRSLERIDSELVDQPLVQARLLHALGGVYTSFGRHERAELALERALAIRRRLLGADHPEVAQTLATLAWYHYKLGHYREALRLNQEELAILEGALGADHPRVANSRRHLGREYWMLGDFGRSQAQLDRALEILEKTPDEHPLWLAVASFWRGILATEVGDYEIGVQHFERALALRREHLGPDHPATSWVEHDYGRLLHRMGDFERSEAVLRHSLQVHETVYGPENPFVAFPLTALADLLRETGRYGDARALYERALELRTLAFGENHVEVLWTLTGLGWLEINTGHPQTAAEIFDRATAIADEVLPAGRQMGGWSRMGAGASRHLLGDHDAAVEQAELALGILEGSFEETNAMLAWPHHHLGRIHLESGDLERARPPLERALEIREGAVGPAHPHLAADLLQLAVLESRSGNAGTAEALFDRALEISVATRGPDDRFTRGVRREYARHLRAAGDAERASALEPSED